MANHGNMRWKPDRLKPGTRSIISLRINYLEQEPASKRILGNRSKGFISKYAQGRDYHKTIRTKLKLLEKKIKLFCEKEKISGFESRLITDSAPLLEKAVAEKAGLGWIGKNTLLINKTSGSYFFLGEILTNLPLAEKGKEQPNQCGKCQACIKICPTELSVPLILWMLKGVSLISPLRIVALFQKSIGSPWEIESSAAMIAKLFVLGTVMQNTTWKKISNPATVLITRSLNGYFYGAKRNSIKKLRVLLSSVLAMTGGLEISQLLWEMPKKTRKSQIFSCKKKGLSSLVDEHINWALEQHSKDPI